MQNGTEYELIRRCQEGDKVAFAQLVRANQQMVFNLLHRLIPDWMDLEDIAQDVWVKVYQSISKMKNYASFKTWLHRIAVNTYYDKMRKFGHRVEISLDEPVNDDENQIIDIPDTKLLPEDLILNAEWKSYVEEKIKALPEQHRLIIVMRDVQNLSYDEIAEVTGLSLGTVKSRIARAREKLVSELSDYFKEVKADVS
ncbi:sigma-70 family RNA polymerase sigma factor [bacterium]|nr:MAG: sigma-70 family RNA polymerase sigma factor [bacterium]